MILYTTMSRIRNHGPCESGWYTLLRNTGRSPRCDLPLPYSEILASNGLNDCFWALARAGDMQPAADALLRSFACVCAYRVLPIYERAYPGENRPRAAIDAAWGFVQGRVTVQEKFAAWRAAYAVAEGPTGGAASRAAAAAAQTFAPLDAAVRAASYAAAAAAAAATAELPRRTFDKMVESQAEILREMLKRVEDRT